VLCCCGACGAAVVLWCCCGACAAVVLLCVLVVLVVLYIHSFLRVEGSRVECQATSPMV